jgi:hypothetical protein
MMTAEEMRRHADRCTTLKFLSIVPLLGSVGAVAFTGIEPTWAAVLLAGLWMLAFFGLFVVMQTRAEAHWDLFMQGAREHLGEQKVEQMASRYKGFA